MTKGRFIALVVAVLIVGVFVATQCLTPDVPTDAVQAFRLNQLERVTGLYIVVSKEELSAVQDMFTEIIAKVNELDPEAKELTPNVETILNKLKDTAHVSYRWLTGDFKIEINTQLLVSSIKLGTKVGLRLLPVFHAMQPVINLLPELKTAIKQDFDIFFEERAEEQHLWEEKQPQPVKES